MLGSIRRRLGAYNLRFCVNCLLIENEEKRKFTIFCDVFVDFCFLLQSCYSSGFWLSVSTERGEKGAFRFDETPRIPWDNL